MAAKKKSVVIKTAAAAVLGAVLAIQSPMAVSGGIPVFDGAAVANTLQQIVHMKEQIDNQLKQIDQLKKQVSSITGTRNLGQIMDNPLLKKYLPNDWQKVYSSMQSGGKGGMTASAQALADAAGLFKRCEKITASAQKSACENSAGQVAQRKSYLLNALEATQTRLNQIDSLMGQINQTTDPKAIAELQARIGAEQAHISNMNTQMNLYNQIADQQEKIARQQERMSNADRVRAGTKKRN